MDFITNIINIIKPTYCGDLQRSWHYIQPEINEQILHNSRVYECRLIHKQLSSDVYIQSAIDTSINIEARKTKNEHNLIQLKKEYDKLHCNYENNSNLIQPQSDEYIKTISDIINNNIEENAINRFQIEKDRISFLRDNISHFKEFGVFPPNE